VPLAIRQGARSPTLDTAALLDPALAMRPPVVLCPSVRDRRDVRDPDCIDNPAQAEIRANGI